MKLMLAWWVFFTDKGPVDTPRALAEAWAQLTQRAKERRLKNGYTVGPGDLPVYEGYIREIERRGGVLIGTSRWLNAAAFRLSDTAGLRALPFVRDVRPVRPMAHPKVRVKPVEGKAWDSTEYGGAWWQLEMMQVPEVHQLGYRGEGVLVGFLDTGFHIQPGDRHPALESLRVVATWDFINGDTVVWNEPGDPSSQDFHGTICMAAVGGYLPGELIGVAPRAQFALAKTEDVSDEYPEEEVYYVEGLEWLEGLGCDLTSSSLAYFDWYSYEDLDGDHAVTTVAVDSAAARGLLCVTAMGNSGPDPGSLGAPADADSCVSVGAVDADGWVADFSSRGPTYDGRTKPELVAMGVDVYSVDPYSSGYGRYSGTSLATPLVAGAAALLIQAFPEMSNMEIRQLLMETATHAQDPDNNHGWGVPQLLNALQQGVSQKRAPKSLPFRLLGRRLVYELPFPSRLQVYDPAGRLVLSRGLPAGEGSLRLELRPGVYVVSLAGLSGAVFVP